MPDDPRMTDQAPELLPCEKRALQIMKLVTEQAEEMRETLTHPNPTPTPSERPMVPEIPFDPTNHHNALKCPYCNPDSLVLVAPADRPVPQMRELLREARQYVSDAGNDEDAETQRNSQALLDEIDAALTVGRHVSQGVRTTAEIEQILFSHFYTGEPGEHEAIKAAAIALASERPVPQVREAISKEWCLEMAKLEGEAGDPDCAAGSLELPIVKELRDQAAHQTKGADNPFEARKQRVEWRAASTIERLTTTFTDKEWHDALMGTPKARPPSEAVAWLRTANQDPPLVRMEKCVRNWPSNDVLICNHNLRPTSEQAGSKVR